MDPQHPETSIDGPVERISATILEAMPRLSQIIRSENVVIVIGFPPCTDVAVSGSRWFESKRAKDPHFGARPRWSLSNAGWLAWRPAARGHSKTR